ncbi:MULTISPECIES: helix-turn-helix domain-containing protein, partial [Enterobacteriaceae]
RSHWSTSKTPSYTKSVSWQHHLTDYLYMSESLIKKKLLLENTSFSKLLLDTRMAFAIKLLKQNRPLKQVSESCGFSSISYFVYLFRQYYNCTPCEYAKHQLSSGK